MKKIRVCLLTMLFIFIYGISTLANETPKTTIIQIFDDGSYIESTLQENSGPYFRSITQKNQVVKQTLIKAVQEK